jgi:phosphoenolpyruvate---glycerone phosphotransferase subunit DhaK
LKKLINAPADYVAEALAGMIATHPATFALTGASRRVVVRATPKPSGRVGVITGGGFGHLPLFAGYVGQGLLDACAVGDVFAGPSADSVGEAFAAADRGAGVLAVIGNYGGDKLAFGMASDDCADRGVPVATVIGNDDVASAGPEEAAKRRGVAGIIFAFKAAGAAAEQGLPLDKVAAIAGKAVARCRTVGLALSSCTIPTRGQPTFEIEDGAVEMGMGIHGEKGVWRGALKPADALVDEMMDRLAADYPIAGGARYAVLVNSLGATPLEELFIVYRRVAWRMSAAGATVALPMVGHYVTSMEMAGASISLLHLDDELEGLLGAPTGCPFWRTT